MQELGNRKELVIKVQESHSMYKVWKYLPGGRVKHLFLNPLNRHALCGRGVHKNYIGVVKWLSDSRGLSVRGYCNCCVRYWETRNGDTIESIH